VPDRPGIAASLDAKVIETSGPLPRDREKLLFSLDSVASPRAPGVGEVGRHAKHHRPVSGNGNGGAWALDGAGDSLGSFAPEIATRIGRHVGSKQPIDELDELTEPGYLVGG
jgi:hypothetical protein